MSEQKIITAENNYSALDEYITKSGSKSIMLVCDESLRFLKIKEYFAGLSDRLKISLTYFSNFKPNPLYESVVEGVRLFKEKECDTIIAVGGGSAMDVAKCIKLYSNMNDDENYLKQTIVPNEIPLLAVPTTAGTGSEATRFAVIYFSGEKQSVADVSCIPSVVLMDPSVLKTLPEYQKKSTMLDALCHAIESFWSVNSTEESREFSKTAIQMILANKDAYLANEENGNAAMLKAANIAGKAINITQTTAGHAMCYKLTSLYGIAHGHAAALCLSKLFPFMVSHIEKCIDHRGEDFLKDIFAQISSAMGCDNADQACTKFSDIFDSLSLSVPKAEEKDFNILKNSVNPTRLKNNPVGLEIDDIDMLYHEILAERK